MTQFVDLMRGSAPSGVPHRPLGDVATFRRGTAITKKDTAGGDVPVVAGGRTPAYFHSESNRVGESLTVAGSGAYAGYVAYWDSPIFVSDAFTVHPDAKLLRVRYVYYFLASRQATLHALKQGGGVPHVHGKDLAPLVVPVPPLHVQDEIVRILDSFTSLESELKAELEARERQYAHYRSELLDPSRMRSVRFSTLGKVSLRVSSGATPTAGRPEYYEQGEIPWLRTQEVRFADIWDTEMRITDRALKETAVNWIPANCVIVAISGATAARSAVNRVPMTTNQHCCNLEIDPRQANFRYVYYWVRSRYEALKSLGQGARSDLNSGLIKGFPIALPSLEEQERIVEVLDKFDALVNDLSVGLPAEITARRKQYEYYRDKLLTFEETPA